MTRECRVHIALLFHGFNGSILHNFTGIRCPQPWIRASEYFPFMREALCIVLIVPLFYGLVRTFHLVTLTAVGSFVKLVTVFVQVPVRASLLPVSSVSTVRTDMQRRRRMLILALRSKPTSLVRVGVEFTDVWVFGPTLLPTSWINGFLL